MARATARHGPAGAESGRQPALLIGDLERDAVVAGLAPLQKHGKAHDQPEPTWPDGPLPAPRPAGSTTRWPRRTGHVEAGIGPAIIPITVWYSCARPQPAGRAVGESGAGR